MDEWVGGWVGLSGRVSVGTSGYECIRVVGGYIARPDLVEGDRPLPSDCDLTHLTE